MRCLLALLCTAPLCLAACGGDASTDAPDPGITCKDGYVAHPDYDEDQDGCAPHGGVVDALLDDLKRHLEEMPEEPIVAYVCHDGWISHAVGDQGACSSHGGVWKTVFPDGTQIVVDGPGLGTIYKPDGTVVQPWHPEVP